MIGQRLIATSPPHRRPRADRRARSPKGHAIPDDSPRCRRQRHVREDSRPDEQELHATLHREGMVLVRARALDGEVETAVGEVELKPRRLLLLTQALHEALEAGVPLLSRSMPLPIRKRTTASSPCSKTSRLAYRGRTGAVGCDGRTPARLPGRLLRAGAGRGTVRQPAEGAASIAGFLEWRLEISSIVKQAMVYPFVVATAGYGMVLFMLSFVIPRLGVRAQQDRHRAAGREPHADRRARRSSRQRDRGDPAVDRARGRGRGSR
jgi:hypothetical protein